MFGVEKTWVCILFTVGSILKVGFLIESYGLPDFVQRGLKPELDLHMQYRQNQKSLFQWRKIKQDRNYVLNMKE